MALGSAHAKDKIKPQAHGIALFSDILHREIDNHKSLKWKKSQCTVIFLISNHKCIQFVSLIYVFLNWKKLENTSVSAVQHQSTRLWCDCACVYIRINTNIWATNQWHHYINKIYKWHNEEKFCLMMWHLFILFGCKQWEYHA